MLTIVKEDQVCRRLMTVPGVGAVVSLTYVYWLGPQILGQLFLRLLAKGGGIVQCPESRELFTTMSVRENLHLGGGHLPAAERA